MTSTSQNGHSMDGQSFDDLIEEITDRLQQGEKVEIEEYTARCPQQADRLRRLFPTLVAMASLSEEVDSNESLFDRMSREDLGPYDVRELAGQGGMGVVFKGYEEALERVVAIKVLAPRLASNATARRRFHREAQAAAAISHPHVVTIHAVSENDGLPYLVMEYVSGESLEDKIANQGPLELVEILRVGIQIASGLSAAHGQGLIHRDIKPSNILLENGVQRVKITDFGLARAVDDVGITRTGDVTGTPQYMAPEQAEGEHVDHRADLFGLGCVLYAMCTGRSPFRAETTMATLRRVCEDTPRPIREINPEIPEWLTALIGKLLQKDPAERFESAREVADRLANQLHALQNPTVSQSSTQKEDRVNPVDSPTTPFRPRRRRLVIPIVLAVLLTGLGFTEATGLTNVSEFVATVLRIKTPQGTLVVEVDDPNVKVAIEGDGGLVITGAGPQEVRLKPGQYHLKASKDGEPLHQELVTISRGGKEVINVALEGEAEPLAVTTQAEPDAFVLLGGEGVLERRFDTLADAVRQSSAGDTIEIRGNGPFVSDGVTVQHPLIIRASDGSAPSISLSEAAAATNVPLVEATSLLVLEGLELRHPSGARETTDEGFPTLVNAYDNSGLCVANCRLVLKSVVGHPISARTPVCCVRNCEFDSRSSTAVLWGVQANGRATIENCVSTVGAIRFRLRRPDFDGAVIEVRNNTLVGNGTGFTLWRMPKFQKDPEGLPPIRMAFSRNIIDCPADLDDRALMYVHQFNLDQPLPADEAEALLPRLINLHEQVNAYSRGIRMLQIAADRKPLKGDYAQTLAEWDRLWRQEDTGSVEGQVRFHGGDLLHRMSSAAEELTPEDFRLRPDSAGYQAGTDGEDLGANIDFVGPGDAYERFKETPEYQEWLKETNELIGAEDKNASADYRSVPEGAITQLRRFEGHQQNVLSVAVTPDGGVLSGSGDGTVRLWDLSTASQEHRFDPGPDNVYAVDATSDGELAASSDEKGTVRLWNLETGTEVGRFDASKSAVTGLAFLPRGRRLLSAGHDRMLRLWSVPDARKLREFAPVEGIIHGIAVSADGVRCAAVWHGGLGVWDLQQGEMLWQAQGAGRGVYEIAFSPNGRYVVTGCHFGATSVQLWDIRTGEELRRYDGHTGRVTTVCFTPDGRHIVSGSHDRTIRVWSVDSAKQVVAITCDTHVATHLGLSPDGRLVVSSGGMYRDDDGLFRRDGDYALRLWRLPEQGWPEDANEGDDASRPASEPPAPPLPEQRRAED